MKTLLVYDSKLEQELEILLGQNAQDNWDIIDKADPYDIWFHVEDHPSCHVILRLPDNKAIYNKQTLTYCASICKEHSKFKDYKKISIIYTQIKNITKGDKPGLVHPKKLSKIII
jgi:predicted ribosome quality control (RQC) complex YloA/Tae2 family protein